MTHSKTATPLDLFDDDTPRVWQDDEGSYWRYAVDACDGTVAVEEVYYPSLEPAGRCGVLHYRVGEEAADVWPVEDGATYGVNCEDDYTARDGCWRTTEEE